MTENDYEHLLTRAEELAAAVASIEEDDYDGLDNAAALMYSLSDSPGFPGRLTESGAAILELFMKLKSGELDFEPGYRELCSAVENFKRDITSSMENAGGDTWIPQFSQRDFEDIKLHIDLLDDIADSLEPGQLDSLDAIENFCSKLYTYDYGATGIERSIENIARAADSLAGGQTGLDETKALIGSEIEMMKDLLKITAPETQAAAAGHGGAPPPGTGSPASGPGDGNTDKPGPAPESDSNGDDEQSHRPAAGNGIEIPEFEIDSNNPELIDFITETNEYLDNAEAALIELEKRPESKKLLNEVFRFIHNIKGISGFLNIGDVQQLSHTAESMLDKARDGRLAFSPQVASAALDTVDLLRLMITGVEAALQGRCYCTPDGYAALIERLLDIMTGELHANNNDPRSGDNRRNEMTQDNTNIAPDPEEETIHMEEEPVDVSSLEKAMDAAGEFMPEMNEEIAAAGPETPPPPLDKKLEPVNDILKKQNCSKGQSLEAFVKIGTGRLDTLIEAVGELVVANAMIKRKAEQEEDLTSEHVQHSTQLDNITRDLQELAMSLRMVSLKPTFIKMSRIARDLSYKSHSEVDFTYSGEDTEIDRNVVEEITSPLVHMVRNAMDHGISPPEERERLGKPRRGRVHLSAYHEGGNVVIKLEDDGRGLDRDAIVKKARAMGLVAEDAELKEKDIFDLIFEPGFSTAAEVTDISGRGVGMDVVRKNIENLRGRIEIQSERGRGTAFIIRLPITLAIIDGMMVKAGVEEYIIPTISIQESLKPAPENLSTVVNEGEVASIRGELMPLLRIGELLGIEGAAEDPLDGLLIIIEDNNERFALLVDDLMGQQQVVIKSLGKIVGRPPGIAGGAIIGDGSVALIIDPPGLQRMADN